MAQLDAARQSAAPARTASPDQFWWKRRELWFWSIVLTLQTGPLDLFLGTGGHHYSYWMREAVGLMALASLLRPGWPSFAIYAWPVGLFVLSSVFTSILAPGVFLSLKGLALFVLTGLPAFAAARRLRPADFCRVFFLVLLLGCLISVALAIAVPRIGVAPTNQSAGIDEVGGWRGLYIHKNVLGHAAGILFGLTFFAGKPILKDNRLWIAALLIAAVCVVGSKSSTALILCVALPAFYAAVVYPPGLWRVLSVLVTATLFITALLERDLLVHTALGALGKNSSLSGRTDIWAYALGLIAQHPITGWGYGYTDTLEYNDALKIRFNVPHTHNDYLQILLDAGAIGLILMLLAIAYPAFEAWRRKLPDVLANARSFWSVLALGWLISAWSEVSLPMFSQFYYAAVFGLCGVAAASRVPVRRRQPLKSKT